ncbi:hypothetical protein AVEN_161276-1 [Araneus ventricosus]|uniref:Uncharacterized protein n=1 Tax=Araneus ventricosus TaxID=182803 RepID=A0A4Y2IAE6_ARAVE|nr:hypothetical protein AVEN_161276-1 [Araneus ventricosus]
MSLSCLTSLMFGKRVLRGEYGMAGPGLGDKSTIPENATLFSISLLGKKIRFNVREHYVTSRSVGESIYGPRLDQRSVLIHENYLGVSSEVRARKLVS